MAGASQVAGTVNGGEGADTFIWEGGRLGSGGANSLDLGQLQDFEHLTLTPAADINAEITADDLTAALNLSAGNTLTLGPGITFNPGDALDLAGGSDRLQLNGARISGTVMLSGGNDTFELEGTSQASGTVNGGTGDDTFRWEGGTLGAGDANSLDLTRLEDFENLSLNPAAGSTAEVTAAGLTAALNLNASNRLTLGSGVTVTFNPSDAFDLGGGSDRLHLNGGRISGAVMLGGGNDLFSLEGTSQASGTVNAGTGDDTFVWEGGTLGAGGENTLDLTRLEDFEHLSLTPAAGINAEVAAADLTAALNLSAANSLTLGSGITFNLSDALDLGGGNDDFTMQGTSRVSGTVKGGTGFDTFTWEGGTLGTGGENTLDLTELENFENLTLTQAAGSNAEVTAAGLTAALNLSTNNRLTLGPGITFNPSAAFDLGGGIDTLEWTGATVGDTDGELDLSKFTALETLVLTPPEGVQQSFSGEAVAAALSTGSANRIEMYPDVSITSTLNAGAGYDSFLWFGGTVGAGADDSIDFDLLQGFESVQLGPTTLPVKALDLTSLPGKGISELFIGRGVSVSGTVTLTNISGLEILRGTLETDVSATDSIDGYQLRGTVHADLNLMGGSDTLALGRGTYSGSWDGGPGIDWISISTLSSANIDDIDLCDVTLTNFERGALLDRGSGSSVCMSSMSFQSLSLEVGESSPRLEIRGDVTAGIELQIDRSYDVRSTNLRRPDALVVGGQNGRFNTDGTAGFDCTGSRCDLMLYDRAVPLALSLSAALDASMNGALAGSPSGQQAALKPPEYRSVSSRPVSGSISQQGSVAWSLDTRSRLNGSLSGAELSGQWRLGRDLGLRHDARAVHLDVHTSGLSSYGGYQIQGRITGTDHRLSILWGGRLLGGGQGRLGLTTQLAHYRSNSVELFERPVSARLRANIAAVQLAGYHSLLGETAFGLRASVRMQAGQTQLEGLDGVRVSVAGSQKEPQWRAGLVGEINTVTQLTKLTTNWSVDWVSMGGGRSAEVLNDRQSDRVRWQQPEEFLQYRLGLSAGLSQRSRVRFELQRQDALDAAADAAAAGLQSKDYSARLSFHTSF